MIFSLLVLGSPHAHQSADSAWHFAHAAVDAGHRVYRVFFYHEGVFHGSELAVTPQDEVNPVQRWATFARANDCELVLCISSALKRGLLDADEADRHDKSTASVHPAFELSGLGQLVDAAARSDRLITFGE